MLEQFASSEVVVMGLGLFGGGEKPSVLRLFDQAGLQRVCSPHQ